jgi:hypothetical protein
MSLILNGTGSIIGFNDSGVTNGPDASNASVVELAIDATTGYLRSTKTGTGSYLPLVLWTNNAERMRIDTNGRVGIGISPSAWSTGAGIATLDIGAGAAITGTTVDSLYAGNLNYDNVAAGWKRKVAGYSLMQTLDFANGNFIWSNAPTGAAGSVPTITERMRIDSVGNVGIGTTAPENYATRTSVDISGPSGGNGAIIVLRDAASTVKCQLFSTTGGDPAFVLRTITAQPLVLGTNGVERMRIDTSGNVGIGVTPTSNLHVKNSLTTGTATDNANVNIESGNRNTSLTLTQGGSYSGSIVFVNTTAGVEKGRILYSNASDYMAFYTATAGAAERMRLDSSGRLGISTTATTAATLTVGATSLQAALFQHPGGVTFGTVLTLETTGGTDLPSLSFKHYNAGTPAYFGIACNAGALTFNSGASTGGFGTERMRIDNTSFGRLLIGTTVLLPSEDAQVQIKASNNTGMSVQAGTNNYAVTYRHSTGGICGSVTATGTTTCTFNTSSDYRLKNNQQLLTGSGAFIDSLQPKTWQWTDGTAGVGFIAHEVQVVSPTTVVGQKDDAYEDGTPKYQMMEYGSAEFIANIIAELQSLRQRVAPLEATIEQLTIRLTALENK